MKRIVLTLPDSRGYEEKENYIDVSYGTAFRLGAGVAIRFPSLLAQGNGGGPVQVVVIPLDMVDDFVQAIKSVKRSFEV